MNTRNRPHVEEAMRKLRLDKHWTLQEIGDLFGVTREAVRQRIGNTGRLSSSENLPTSPDMITDSYSFYSARCPKCGGLTMRAVRPGKIQCEVCG